MRGEIDKRAGNQTAAPVDSDPGDQDPSREVPAAEIGIAFDGRSNGGSADLGPFLTRKIKEIAARISDDERRTTNSDGQARGRD